MPLIPKGELHAPFHWHIGTLANRLIAPSALPLRTTPPFMLDMMKMMGKVKEMQTRLREAQDKLDLLIVHGEAGAGMVKATVNGKKKILAIEVDPSILSTQDKVLLQDLVVAAVNKAMEEAEVRAREEIRKSTEGLLPQVPGLDLSQLMG